MRNLLIATGLIFTLFYGTVSGAEQTIQLNASMNRISFHVLPENSDAQSVFFPLIEAGQLISVEEGVTQDVLQYNGSTWENTIGEIDPGYGYFVEVNTATVLTVMGEPVELPLEVTIPSGESLIGYPYDIPQDLEFVLYYLTSNNMVQSIMDPFGGMYIPMYGMNSIGDLQPGVAYTITVTSPVTFQFCLPGVICECDKGDVNGDGWIDALDIAGLINMVETGINLTPETFCAGDMDEDGYLTIVDWHILQFYYLMTILPDEAVPMEIFAEDVLLPQDADTFTITMGFSSEQTVNSFEYHLVFDSWSPTDLELIDATLPDNCIVEVDNGYRIVLDITGHDPGYPIENLEDISLTFALPDPFYPEQVCFQNGAAYSNDGYYMQVTGDCFTVNREFDPDYSGPVWNVSPSGSVGGNGSIYYPMASIQTAIDYAADGDTVLVFPGTYVENIDFLGKDIVVGSYTLVTGDTTYVSQTVIDGYDNDSVVTFESGETEAARLVGFTITNGIPVDAGGGIRVENASPTIERCIIQGNFAASSCAFDGIGMGGGIALINSAAVVKNSVIRNNETCGGWGDNGRGGGIYILNSQPTLERLVVSQNHSGRGGAVFAVQSVVEIEHCTFSGNSAQSIFSDYGDEIYSDGSVINLHNSIVWGSTNMDIVLLQEAGYNQLSVSFSDIYGGEGGIMNPDQAEVNWMSGNITDDPLFVNPQESDYSLQLGSPCINAGDPDSPIDPDGTVSDMGAVIFPLNTAPYEGPVYFVSPEGNNFDNGSQNYPVATIQRAIGLAADGDTVFVAPGTYSGPVDFDGKNLFISSYQFFEGDGSYIHNTVIDGNGETECVVLTYAPYSEAGLNGFTLTNGVSTSSGMHAGGLTCRNVESPVFSNLIITGNQNGGVELMNAAPLFMNVEIANNTGSFGGGINIRDGSHAILDHVLIADNEAEVQGGGLRLKSGSVAELNNVTIAGNVSDAGGGIHVNNSELTLTNSIVYWNSASDYISNSTVNVSWSDIQFYADGEGVLHLDPLFIDTINGDYTLQYDSPCIDAGDPDPDGDGITWENDPDDQDPDGTRLDLGAFFYSQVTPLEQVVIYFQNLNTSNNTVELWMENQISIQNVTINFSGFQLTGWYGGSAEEYGFTISEVDSGGISLSGESQPIPPGDALLITLNFAGWTGEPICFTGGSAVDDSGSPLSIELGGCISPSIQHFTPILNGYELEYLEYHQATGLGIMPVYLINGGDGVDIGDEIGLFDYNGITDISACPGNTGEILVGAAVVESDSVDLTAYGAIIECDEIGTIPGFIEGNELYVKIWKSELGVEVDGILMDGSELYSLFTGEGQYLTVNVDYSSLMMGDVNFDGTTDVLDIIIIVDIIIGNHDPAELQLYVSDVNFDNVLNVMDIINIVNAIIGE